MMDPQTALQSIYSIAKLIYDQARLVKANQAQCTRLAERVRIAEESVYGLNTIENKDHYQRGLNDLLTCLNNCLRFMQEFSNSNSWFKYILKTGTYRDKFQELNDELQKSMQQLNLGLAAQQIVNHQQDKVDQASDYRFILSNQDRIIQLNQEANSKIQQLSSEQREGQFIILQQLASMKEQITALNINRSIPKPLLDPRYMVPYFELMFDKKIADSAFGEIYLGRWNEQVVSIKLMENLLTEQDKDFFIREVQIISQLRNQQIVQFYGACLESGRACLIMEYMEKGSLYEVLAAEKLSAEQQKNMALDIARGLHYLHSQGVVHRDLQSANVLINKYGQAKLADFGLSKTKATSVKTAGGFSQAVQWLAPEFFTQRNNYIEQSDIYSYGVILWEIVTGQRPYATLDDILNKRREPIPNIVADVYVDLIEMCRQQDPAKRPDLSTIIHRLDISMLRPSSPGPEECYQQGIACESEKQYEQARVYYDKALKKDYYKANTNLGLFCLKGRGGMPQNKKQAHDYFLKGAERGHVRAMYNLAMMLERGDGIDKNEQCALNWYEKAAQQGDQQAVKKCEELRLRLQDVSYRSFDHSMKNTLFL
ncbi:MAG: hypothetical protein A3F41_02960 [Coxiella sp. RIFCSPHIGHO2_12_FULL_44_14]|nr:MAG: hypothetical protein A3F41_02960 [Coxiella sp. RIFCSPHIGHO2_12_FULL_44_14]